MSRIFLCSDTHFGHDREFLWGPRGFTSSKGHDEAIITNWNSVVGPTDIVYHLGDLMLGDNIYGIECVKRLNGHIKLIRGNHDTDARWKLYATLSNVECIGWAEVIKYKKYQFYLSHHPTMTSNLEKAPYLRMHLINLYGHTHQTKPFYNDTPFMFHAGLDSNNNKPILLDDIIELMKQETLKCLEFLEEGASSIDPTAQVGNPAEAQTQTCHRCIHEHLCPSAIIGYRCADYKYDPPDGGYYG